MMRSSHGIIVTRFPALVKALISPVGQRALGIMPEPADAPVPRVTLSLPAITKTRALMLAATGNERRAVIEAAIHHASTSKYRIGRLLAPTQLPVDIPWAPG